MSQRTKRLTLSFSIFAIITGVSLLVSQFAFSDSGASETTRHSLRASYVGTPSSFNETVLNEATPSEFAGFGESILRAFLDGDAVPDLVVGVPGAVIGGMLDAGEVHVLRSTGGDLNLSHPSPKIDGAFGSALAVGDANGDGETDIAVGAPEQEVAGLPEAGSVVVFFGPGFGNSVVLSQVSSGACGSSGPEEGARFGAALAFADLDGDGDDELLAGAPEASPGGLSRGGQVFRFEGDAASPLATMGCLLDPEPAEDNGYGEALVRIGDLNLDGADEVAIGAPGASVDLDAGAGKVIWFEGGASPASSTLLGPHPDAAAAFGSALASGDLTGDGIPDLGVGAPYARAGLRGRVGAVTIYEGGAAPSLSISSTVLDPRAEQSSMFGLALALGEDLDGDGAADLMVGAPVDSGGAGGLLQGKVVVFLGPALERSRVTSGEAAQDVALFGESLAVGDFDGDGCSEVAVGSPGADVGAEVAAGSVLFLSWGPEPPETGGQVILRFLDAGGGLLAEIVGPLLDPPPGTSYLLGELAAVAPPSTVEVVAGFTAASRSEIKTGRVAWDELSLTVDGAGNLLVNPSAESDSTAPFTSESFPPPGLLDFSVSCAPLLDWGTPSGPGSLSASSGSCFFVLTGGAPGCDTAFGVMKSPPHPASAGDLVVVSGMVAGETSLSDSDGDGVVDASDNCVLVPNLSQSDGDGDGAGDACDNCLNDFNTDQKDADSDGLGDLCDNCASEYNPGEQDLIDPNIVVQLDSDADGSGDECDNCPDDSNIDQEDVDGDNVGDACDNCVDLPNAEQEDSDADGRGNTCDNCPAASNPDQQDSDLDGLGDVCDNCPDDPTPQGDADNDGFGDSCDNCSDEFNPSQFDWDSDGLGNRCDNCAFEANTGQQDTDDDGVGDVCDNCPEEPNPNQSDADNNGVGDVCEPTNCPPVTRILHPLEDSTVGSDLTLAGQALDLEEGPLSGLSLAWSSSLDGPLGDGTSLGVTLSPGAHVLTLTGTDSEGDFTTAEVAVTVLSDGGGDGSPPETADPDLVGAIHSPTAIDVAETSGHLCNFKGDGIIYVASNGSGHNGGFKFTSAVWAIDANNPSARVVLSAAFFADGEGAPASLTPDGVNAESPAGLWIANSGPGSLAGVAVNGPRAGYPEEGPTGLGVITAGEAVDPRRPGGSGIRNARAIDFGDRAPDAPHDPENLLFYVANGSHDPIVAVDRTNGVITLISRSQSGAARLRNPRDLTFIPDVPLLGDANNDGVVDDLDMNFLGHHLAVGTGLPHPNAADVDRDGDRDRDDLEFLFRHRIDDPDPTLPAPVGQPVPAEGYLVVLDSAGHLVVIRIDHSAPLNDSASVPIATVVDRFRPRGGALASAQTLAFAADGLFYIGNKNGIVVAVDLGDLGDPGDNSIASSFSAPDLDVLLVGDPSSPASSLKALDVADVAEVEGIGGGQEMYLAYSTGQISTIDMGPDMRIDAPLPGDLVRTTIPFEVTAVDPHGVQSVTFFADYNGNGKPDVGEEIALDSSAPFVTGFDSTTAPDGPFILIARAVDALGFITIQSVSILIDNTPPEIVDVEPDDGATEVSVSDAAVLNSIRVTFSESMDTATISNDSFFVTPSFDPSIVRPIFAALGDVDGDGILTFTDAAYLARAILDDLPLIVPNAADVNIDGIVDEDDVAAIVDELVGLPAPPLIGQTVAALDVNEFEPGSALPFPFATVVIEVTTDITDLTGNPILTPLSSGDPFLSSFVTENPVSYILFANLADNFDLLLLQAAIEFSQLCADGGRVRNLVRRVQGLVNAQVGQLLATIEDAVAEFDTVRDSLPDLPAILLAAIGGDDVFNPDAVSGALMSHIDLDCDASVFDDLPNCGDLCDATEMLFNERLCDALGDFFTLISAGELQPVFEDVCPGHIYGVSDFDTDLEDVFHSNSCGDKLLRLCRLGRWTLDLREFGRGTFNDLLKQLIATPLLVAPCLTDVRDQVQLACGELAEARQQIIDSPYANTPVGLALIDLLDSALRECERAVGRFNQQIPRTEQESAELAGRFWEIRRQVKGPFARILLIVGILLLYLCLRLIPYILVFCCLL